MRPMSSTLTACCTLVLLAGGTGGALAADAQQITGAGSTFAAPIYGRWAEGAKASTGLSLNYQAIGSGGGQNQIMNRTVDFGASDAPMSTDRLTSGHLMQFPTVMGAVDIIVNLPGVEANQLKLTGPVLAQIYLGTITKWNDAKIAALNPGMKLPTMAIAPVYRADGSGTTYVFTDYLSMANADWKSQVGANTSVQWAAGTGARGSDGVSATVRNIRGGIGYVESAYAIQNKLTTVSLQNKAGKFVDPTPKTFAAAAAAGDWKNAQNFAIDLNDEPGDKSWPIVSATFVLVPINPTDPAKTADVLKFFGWGFANGDQAAVDLQYVPLPQSVKDSVRAAWTAQIKGPNGQPLTQ